MYIALAKQSYPFGDKCYNYIFNTIGKNNWIFIFLQTYRNNRSSIVLIPALGYFFVSEKSITCIFIIIIYPSDVKCFSYKDRGNNKTDY